MDLMQKTNIDSQFTERLCVLYFQASWHRHIIYNNVTTMSESARQAVLLMKPQFNKARQIFVFSDMEIALGVV